MFLAKDERLAGPSEKEEGIGPVEHKTQSLIAAGYLGGGSSHVPLIEHCSGGQQSASTLHGPHLPPGPQAGMGFTQSWQSVQLEPGGVQPSILMMASS